MASSIVVTTGPVTSNSVRRGTPRKVFRGIKRTLIRKTIAKVQALIASDDRENNRAFLTGYDPVFITGDSNSATERAFNSVLASLQASMALVEGA